MKKSIFFFSRPLWTGLLHLRLLSLNVPCSAPREVSVPNVTARNSGDTTWSGNGRINFDLNLNLIFDRA